ncbi:MAG: hypothetical protein ACREXX_06510 [Gammaproteobacteria bacterium]
MRRRFQFFLKHDGYCTPPGRAVCALHSAKVDDLKEWLESEERIRFEWRWDDDADWSWMDEREKQKKHEVHGCVLFVDGEVEDSLWGIFDPDNHYRRIIEKDLLSEHIARNNSLGLPLGGNE